MSLPPYKHPFRPGEVLLVYFQRQPAFFVRVEHVYPDVKKGWWRLHFITLTLPIEPVTWILDEDQMRGAEFTMGGHPIHLERIETETKKPAPKKKDKPKTNNKANIISLFGDE